MGVDKAVWGASRRGKRLRVTLPWKTHVHHALRLEVLSFSSPSGDPCPYLPHYVADNQEPTAKIPHAA